MFKVIVSCILFIMILITGFLSYIVATEMGLITGMSVTAFNKSNENKTENTTLIENETNATTEENNEKQPEITCYEPQILFEGRCRSPSGSYCESDDECIGWCVNGGCRYSKEDVVDRMDEDTYATTDCCPSSVRTSETEHFVNGELIVTSQDGCACSSKIIKAPSLQCTVQFEYKGDSPAYCLSAGECNHLSRAKRLPETDGWRVHTEEVTLTTFTPTLTFYSTPIYAGDERRTNHYDTFVLDCEN